MSSNDTNTDACRLLIDAIVGRGFLNLEEGDRFVRLKLAHFTGNQHNPAWSWRREQLAKLTEHQLLNLYRREP